MYLTISFLFFLPTCMLLAKKTKHAEHRGWTGLHDKAIRARNTHNTYHVAFATQGILFGYISSKTWFLLILTASYHHPLVLNVPFLGRQLASDRTLNVRECFFVFCADPCMRLAVKPGIRQQERIEKLTSLSILLKRVRQRGLISSK